MIDLGNRLNDLRVAYDGRRDGGDTLRMVFNLGANQYSFYHSIRTGQVFCNCSAYDTENNFDRVREVAQAYLSLHPTGETV